ncbi:HAD family hydrolase [Prolixibacter denitrificans]|uniref:Phosphoglycolate phosphatase n=1 Tax=Prolixibacter denitrificans TaxID=1541063 RepID=A0A2P8C8E4_9BACT|nr:HAD family hydrolase [Prolixibacter denitrificans]PSK81230.1 phosphoglycolate phosphatase [Prolixibacter denitrificans]GET21685.1 phosphoglycolate phosphatase [Prolixibacter denitrificans]
MSFRNILFDLDGTLTDPKEGIFNSILYALREMNIEAPEEETLLSFIGPPLHDSFKHHFSLTDEEADEAVELYRVYFPEKGMYENELYEGIPELLAAVKAAGKKIYLATSKPKVYATEILRHFGLLPFFDGISGPELDGTRNHKAEVIEFVIQVYGIVPEESLMIGDRLHDMKGAGANNIKAVGVTYGYGSAEELQENGAWNLVDSVEELGDLVMEN